MEENWLVTKDFGIRRVETNGRDQSESQTSNDIDHSIKGFWMLRPFQEQDEMD